MNIRIFKVNPARQSIRQWQLLRLEAGRIRGNAVKKAVVDVAVDIPYITHSVT